MRTSDGLDLNAYKLMDKFGYDFNKTPSLGHVIEAQPYGFNDIQKMIQRQSGRVVTPRIGLGYIAS